MELENSEPLCVVCRLIYARPETVSVLINRVGGAALVEAEVTRQPVEIDIPHPPMAPEEVVVCWSCARAIAQAVHDAYQQEEFET
jgi:hypothetical protein